MTEQINEMTAAEMLYTARTAGRRKRELQTIAKQLCIREEYLDALENGRYAEIPELVYILGFARNYALELGLDPDEIIAKIKSEMGLAEEPNEIDETIDAAPAKNQTAGGAVARKSKAIAAGTLEKGAKYISKNWKWLTVVVVALAIAAGSVAMILSLGQDSGNTESVEAVAPAVKEPTYKQAVKGTFGTENRANATVILQAAQESWVKIEDARGDTLFSRVLVPGDVYYVPVGDKIKGTFGNAGGIDVWVNGELAPALGASHTRKTGVLMTPESLLPKAVE
ncbi:MAG: helix-turn-helix domain-containing protein [Rickettsiales bacterium]|jgi:hypothetical protein|nr:helix-turn-helix domain-containing protein [Rickettsiales bacterium]